MTLLIRSIRDEIRGLVGWALLIAAFGILLMVFYNVMVTSGALKDMTQMLDKLPPLLKAFLGGATRLDTLAGFSQGLVFGGMTLLFVTIFCALGVLSLSTRDMDSRTMEFILSLPILRSTLFGIRAAVLLTSLFILQVVLVLSASLGVLLIGKSPDVGLFIQFGAVGFLLFFCVSGILALLATFIDDYPRGVITLIGVALVLFFLGTVIEPRAGEAPDLLRQINPFGHFNTGEILHTGAFPIGDVLYYLGVGAVAWLGAFFSFQRKQI